MIHTRRIHNAVYVLLGILYTPIYSMFIKDIGITQTRTKSASSSKSSFDQKKQGRIQIDFLTKKLAYKLPLPQHKENSHINTILDIYGSQLLYTCKTKECSHVAHSDKGVSFVFKTYYQLYLYDYLKKKNQCLTPIKNDSGILSPIKRTTEPQAIFSPHGTLIIETTDPMNCRVYKIKTEDTIKDEIDSTIQMLTEHKKQQKDFIDLEQNNLLLPLQAAHGKESYYISKRCFEDVSEHPSKQTKIYEVYETIDATFPFENNSVQTLISQKKTIDQEKILDIVVSSNDDTVLFIHGNRKDRLETILKSISVIPSYIFLKKNLSKMTTSTHLKRYRGIETGISKKNI